MSDMAVFMEAMSDTPVSAAWVRAVPGEVLGALGVLGVALGHAGDLLEGGAGLLERGGLFGGARDYAMRLWIKPDRMAQLGITTGDIARAVQEQNSMYATGRIGQEPTVSRQEMTIPVTTRGRLSEPREFENIIVKANNDGSIVRLKDVARGSSWGPPIMNSWGD